MQKQTLKNILLDLNTIFQPPKSMEELITTARVWWGHVSHIPDDQFKECVDEVVKQVKYFPVPSEILAVYNARLGRIPATPQIENQQDRPPEDQIAKNKAFLRDLFKKMAAKQAIRDAKPVPGNKYMFPWDSRNPDKEARRKALKHKFEGQRCRR